MSIGPICIIPSSLQPRSERPGRPSRLAAGGPVRLPAAVQSAPVIPRWLPPPATNPADGAGSPRSRHDPFERDVASDPGGETAPRDGSALHVAFRLKNDGPGLHDVVISWPNPTQIRVVMDNLSTHTAGALYETFPAQEARRILQRLEFHYTPRHASWLTMVEIEISLLRGQCMDRGIGKRAVLNTEVAALQHQRNASGVCIK
jgi:hypothetical protein